MWLAWQIKSTTLNGLHNVSWIIESKKKMITIRNGNGALQPRKILDKI